MPTATWTIKQMAFSPSGQMGRNSFDQFDCVVAGPAVSTFGQIALQLSNLRNWLSTQFASGAIPGWSPGGNLFDNLRYRLIAPATGVWKIELVYRDPNVTKATGDSALRGSTSLARQHVVASVNANSTAYGTNAPTNKGMIGASNPQQPPTGVDIDVPILKFNTIHYASGTSMQSLFNAALGLKGIVNTVAVSFSTGGLSFTCQPHTLKWGGWEFQQRSGFSDWELQNHWEYQPNQTGLTIGTGSNAVTGINKPGWYYLEVGPLVITDNGANAGIWVPNYALVHQVYYEDDLNSLIPSGSFTIGSPWASSLPAAPYPPPQSGEIFG